MALHHLLQVHYNLTCCNVHGRYPLTRAVSNGWREGEHASPGKSCSLASPQSSEIKRAARHGARSGLQVVGNPELPSRAVWPAEILQGPASYDVASPPLKHAPHLHFTFQTSRTAGLTAPKWEVRLTRIDRSTPPD